MKLLVLLAAALSFQVFAISDSAKVGANAGAMTYCKDKVASSSQKSKYNLLAIKSLEEYNKLESDTKMKALVFKNNAEDGDYLGDPLTKKRCDSLRKMLHLQYN